VRDWAPVPAPPTRTVAPRCRAPWRPERLSFPQLSLRGGAAAANVLGMFDPVGHLCALPELSVDKGINVTLARPGAGWRRPACGDEVLISYVGRELHDGLQFERCDTPRLVRLGQGALPPGLERAIVLRFGKGAQGLVTVAPSHAFGEQGRAPLVAPNATVEYNLTLWDWNDIWEAPEGRVLFRGLGQPPKLSAPAGDSDNMTLRMSAVTVQRLADPKAQRASPAPSLTSTLRLPSSHTGPAQITAQDTARDAAEASASMRVWKDRVMSMSADVQEKLKSAAQSLGLSAAATGFVGFDSIQPQRNVTLVMGCGLIEPPGLEVALHNLRLGQKARILKKQYNK